MVDPDPFAPRHIGSALSLTGLVALMTGEGGRPEILGLACGCLAASLVAFAVDLCHTPKPRRSRKARPPLKTRPTVSAQWDAAPARSALPDAPPLHPALSALVRGAPPGATAAPTPTPTPTALHRRALKDVRNRRIARST